MQQRYLLPQAKNTLTGQTIKTQDLTGMRFNLNQRELALEVAQQVATKLSGRTGEPWTGIVVEYTPSSRR